MNFLSSVESVNDYVKKYDGKTCSSNLGVTLRLLALSDIARPIVDMYDEKVPGNEQKAAILANYFFTHCQKDIEGILSQPDKGSALLASLKISLGEILYIKDEAEPIEPGDERTAEEYVMQEGEKLAQEGHAIAEKEQQEWEKTPRCTKIMITVKNLMKKLFG